jgi:iron-sulfur cluster assembly protein
VLIDTDSLALLNGSRIDFVSEGLKQMFRFDNPNVESECGCGESFNMKKPKHDVINPEVTP